MTREPVEYMARTRAFYAAQGYEQAYRWAHHQDVPFQPLGKALADATVTLVTTAMPPRMTRPKKVCSESMDVVPERLFTDDLAWDKEATHTNDLGSFFPLVQMQRAAAAGRIGRLAARYHCVPTEYSQRRTREVDGPAIRDACLADQVDVAILVPL